MTKRDKNLLVLLIILLLVFVPFYFVTFPAIKENPILRAENQTYIDKKADFEMKEKLHQNRLDEKKKLEMQIEDIKHSLPNLSKSYNAHYAFIEMAKANTVTVDSLDIGEITHFKTKKDLAAEEEAKAAAEAKAADDAAANPEGASDETALPPATVIEPHAQTYELQLTMNVSGTVENILKLTDSINEYNKNVSIISVSLGEEAEKGQNATIIVGVYMVLTPEEIGEQAIK